MKHLQNAFERLKNKKLNDNTTLGEYIFLNEEENSVKFVIQNGPLKPFGLNGCQVTDILAFCLELYHSLNETLPCKENIETIRDLGSALNWQIKRTQDRINRNVEGYQLDNCSMDINI